PSPAEAQDATSRQEAARAAGEEGLKLFTSGKWQEALEMFQRAESEFHAVTLVLYMARCQRMRGKLVEAGVLYQQIADEALGAGAPSQFLTAQTQAREELERLRRRIPSLVLVIKGATAGRVHVTVDGALVRVSEGASLELNPGEHALVATVEHAAPIHRTVTLNEGATAKLHLTFDEEAEGPPGSSAVPALIVFGVGAVGLGVGAITGALALDEASDLKARCLPTKRCPALDQARADAAGRLADASTIGFIAGGAAVVTGVVLLLVRPSGGAAPRTGASPVRFNVGLGVVTMEGAF
ncbi:MAG: hypothetical protein ABI134_17635, partial [Byssovorax sp.]